MEKRKKVITGYLLLIYSLTLLFTLINNYTNREVDHWRFFYNFTQQSNIMILIWFSLLSFYLLTDNKKLKFTINSTLMIALAVYISITYFIVALVLDPIYLGKFEPLSSGSELWLHHLTPVVTWIIFALVKSEGEISNKNSLLALTYPLFYVILNLIVGSTIKYDNGDKAYAYGFINPNTYGNIFMFIIVILGLLIVFSLFTLGLTKLKKTLNEAI